MHGLWSTRVYSEYYSEVLHTRSVNQMVSGLSGNYSNHKNNWSWIPRVLYLLVLLTTGAQSSLLSIRWADSNCSFDWPLRWENWDSKRWTLDATDAERTKPTTSQYHHGISICIPSSIHSTAGMFFIRLCILAGRKENWTCVVAVANALHVIATIGWFQHEWSPPPAIRRQESGSSRCICSLVWAL